MKGAIFLLTCFGIIGLINSIAVGSGDDKQVDPILNRIDEIFGKSTIKNDQTISEANLQGNQTKLNNVNETVSDKNAPLTAAESKENLEEAKSDSQGYLKKTQKALEDLKSLIGYKKEEDKPGQVKKLKFSIKPISLKSIGEQELVTSAPQKLNDTSFKETMNIIQQVINRADEPEMTIAEPREKQVNLKQKENKIVQLVNKEMNNKNDKNHVTQRKIENVNNLSIKDNRNKKAYETASESRDKAEYYNSDDRQSDDYYLKFYNNKNLQKQKLNIQNRDKKLKPNELVNVHYLKAEQRNYNEENHQSEEYEEENDLQEVNQEPDDDEEAFIQNLTRLESESEYTEEMAGEEDEEDEEDEEYEEDEKHGDDEGRNLSNSQDFEDYDALDYEDEDEDEDGNYNYSE